MISNETPSLTEKRLTLPWTDEEVVKAFESALALLQGK